MLDSITYTVNDMDVEKSNSQLIPKLDRTDQAFHIRFGSYIINRYIINLSYQC